jgi:hypothetical protein
LAQRAPGATFVIPLRVEDFDPEQGRKDLGALQQLPLRSGDAFAEDVARIAKHVVREFQKQARNNP